MSSFILFYGDIISNNKQKDEVENDVDPTSVGVFANCIARNLVSTGKLEANRKLFVCENKQMHKWIKWSAPAQHACMRIKSAARIYIHIHGNTAAAARSSWLSQYTHGGDTNRKWIAQIK